VTQRGGQPNAALLELSLRTLRQDLDASRAYRIDKPAPVPMDITVVHWARDPEVTQSELAGWERYARQVDFTVIDGGHYAFLSAPAELRELLAAQLRAGAAT
jgi:surfactin synthase thioesterase subunit